MYEQQKSPEKAARWTSGICKTNGIETHYLRTGSGTRPVVLLHGLMLNGACWTPLARTLEDKYDVVMPDARGHGNSSTPDHGYDYRTFAADVVNLIDALALDSPVLLGHSMGGMTAAVAAAQNPNRIRGVVLVDPTFITPQRQQEVYNSDIGKQHLQVLNQPREALLAEMQLRHKGRSHEIIELIMHARLQTSIHAFQILTPPNPNYTELIKALKVPTLLVIGDSDSVISSETAAELARLNPHYLKVVQIAEAGHGIPYDQPKHFSTVVQTFLHSVADF